MAKAWRSKMMWSVVCLLLGGFLTFLGEQRMRSAFLLTQGNLAVAEKQFDSQAYEEAAQIWWTHGDHLLFNQGLRAFWAEHLPQAMQLFGKVSQASEDHSLRSKALYNSGVIMMAMQQPEHAAELFKQALRLNPSDRDAKFNLEQLYRFAEMQDGNASEASLEQLPPPFPKEPRQPSEKEAGSGKGSTKPGI